MSTIAQPSNGLSARLREWLLRSDAIQHARGEQLSADQKAGLKVAQQCGEVAERVLDYPQNYESGVPLGPVLSLYKDAVWWSLQVITDRALAGEDLAAEESPAQIAALRAAVESEAELVQLRTQFLLRSRQELALLDDQSQIDLTARVRPFARALLTQAGARDERLFKVSRQRWLRPLLVLGSLAGACLVFLAVFGPKDVAANKPWRTSSRESTFDRVGNTSAHGGDGLLFHTAEEENPWVIIDLESTRKVGAIEVTNRQTCCKERAVPLVVELSMDSKSWTEVARQDVLFETWDAKFPTRPARYVRLRVPRKTFLHLQSVEVLGR